MKQLEKSRSASYNLGYHIIFCTKYRRKLITDLLEIRLKEILQQTAKDNDWEIATLETMPDHVHVFVKCTPMDSPAKMKGKSSFVLRNEFPWLKSKLPSLWTRSYYVESIGSISAAAITRYIEEQKKR